MGDPAGKWGNGPKRLRGFVFCLGLVALMSAPGWAEPRVIMPLADTASSAQEQRLRNAGFEQGAEPWQGWMNGFEAGDALGRNGSRGVRCVSTSSTEQQHGVMQLVTLNQEQAQPVIVTGWSRAEQVDGASDTGYAVYLDITYRDGEHLWAQTACFSVGTHDWEQRRVVLTLPKPIQTISVLGLFRGHNGTVYFDDFSCVQLIAEQGVFEGVPVGAVERPASSPGTGEKTKALGLAVDPSSGAIVALLRDGETLGTGGVPVFLRDAQREEGFVSPEWRGHTQGRSTELSGDYAGLRLSVGIESNDRCIDLHGGVWNNTEADRAVTVYVPIPVTGEWNWESDMRRNQPAKGLCINAFRTGAGATGMRSSYPLAVLSNAKGTLALAAPIDEAQHYRLAYDADRGLFYAAFDVGLPAASADKPSRAGFHAMLFVCEGGFRGALERYYCFFPECFKKRVPREGLWMAFTDIASLPNPGDFGFAYQEGGTNLPWEEQHGILSFPYTEPMTTWFKLAPEVPRTYQGAVDYLQSLLNKPEDPQHEAAEIVAASSVQDAEGKSILSVVNAPWCDGCVFALNADPSIPVVAPATVNRGQSELRRFEKEVTEPKQGATADGAYIDSYEFWANTIDYRREHWANAQIPLVFDAQTHRVGMLTAFSTFAFQRELAKSMHARGKFMMANGVFLNYDLPAADLDVLGTETNWMPNGIWQPMTDAELCFRRALSFQRPYCFLMNTHFADFSLELTERYMQRALAYGMFPGFFSENAATECYFANPKWYEPARPLFKKYLPLIQLIAKAGWEPVTHASTNNPRVYVERFGKPEGGVIYFTVLNDSQQACQAEITFDSSALGWSQGPASLRDLVADQDRTWEAPGVCRITLNPERVALLHVAR